MFKIKEFYTRLKKSIVQIVSASIRFGRRKGSRVKTRTRPLKTPTNIDRNRGYIDADFDTNSAHAPDSDAIDIHSILAPHVIEPAQILNQQDFEQHKSSREDSENSAQTSASVSPEPPAEQTDWMKGRLFGEIDLFLRNQRSEHTKRAYKNDLKQFVSFLRQTKSSPTLDTLIEYRDWMTREAEKGGRSLSKTSANRKIACVRSFLTWLQSRGEIKENHGKWLKGYRASRVSKTQGLSNVQVRAILDAPNQHTASGIMHALVLHFLFYFGLRRSELIQIKLSDFILQRLGEDVVLALRVQGKGDRERILPLPKHTESVLHDFCRRRDYQLGSDTYLFKPVRNNVTGRRDKHIDAETVAYVVKKYSRQVGVEANITPHSCRATCISNALEQGASHKSVQDLAGWTSPLMIERYDKRRLQLKNSAVYDIKY